MENYKKYFFVYGISLFQFYVGFTTGKPFYLVMGTAMLFMPTFIIKMQAAKDEQKAFKQQETDRIIQAIKSKE